MTRMDSYFKAAVCDLDKLLDEFEQNTGWFLLCLFVEMHGQMTVTMEFESSIC